MVDQPPHRQQANSIHLLFRRHKHTSEAIDKMPHLSELSAEILSLILEHCDCTTVHSLSLVSPLLHSFSNQFLYSDIDWIYHHDHRQPRYPPLLLLLRTLLERPKLALFIKRVNLDDHYLVYMEDHLKDLVPTGSLDLQTVNAAMTLVSKMGLPQKDRWHTALREGCVDAVIALILSQLSNLETLKLAMCLVDESVFVGMVMTHLIMGRGEAYFFNRLRYIKFAENVQAYDAVDLKTNIDQIAPCFFLPSLNELVFTIHEPDFSPWPLPKSLPLKQPSQSLRTLRLYQCNINAEHIAKLVMFAPAIRVLQCGLLRDNRAFDELDKIDFADLCSALLPTVDTLEELTIDIQWCEKNCVIYSMPLSAAGRVPMGSLQHFHSLKRLEIPTALLLGDHPRNSHEPLSTLLPPSLRYLCLTDHTVTWESHSERRNPVPPRDSMYSTIDALAKYLTNRTQNAPFLHHIDLKHEGKHWKGSSLLDPEYVGDVSRPTQAQQLRRIAEANCVAVSVFYMKQMEGKGSRRASLVVYDPENPDQGLVEHGASCIY